MTKRLVFIAGPTAGGKSSLAIDIALKFDGTIINADSMQIYRELSIVTARPGPEDEQKVPHCLYGHISGREDYNAARWAQDAYAEVLHAWDEGRLPIIVGGTGLYFRTIIDGVADIPEIPAEIRSDVRARMAELGPEQLHQELSKVDPEIAVRLALKDQQRISRALEVFYATGKPLSGWQKDTPPGPLAAAVAQGEAATFVLSWPRELLYQRCDMRFDIMMKQGALLEVQALIEKGISSNKPVMKALGVPSLVSYLQNRMELEQAIEEAKMLTRRFAKRQMTWFRNQLGHWEHLYGNNTKDNMIKIEKIIQN